MFFGATSSSANRGPHLVDLNLLPTEYRPRPFPIVSIGLAVLVLGCALLLYAAYYVKTYTDLEIAQLTARVQQGETVVRAATGDPAAAARQDQLRAMRDDFNVLDQRQINWGDVFQTIGDTPSGVTVGAISQAGFGVTITGSANDSAAAAAYVNKLRASHQFVDAALQLRPGTAIATATPSATPVPPTPQPPPATPIPQIQPVPVVPTPVPVRPRPVSPVQPVIPAPPATPTSIATSIAMITPTAGNTDTATPTVAPTAAFDFVLASTRQLPTSNPMVGTSDIKGTVVDLNGKPLGGLTVEIDSEGTPPWTTSRVTDATTGGFDFAVSHGKFKVFVVAGRSQPALDLYTGADGVAGTFGYQLTFQATFSGTPTTDVLGSPTDTTTPSPTATPSETPISLGQNVAAWGCANAYLQNSPSVHLGNNANLAIDGNLGSEWNAGVAPSNGSYVIWQWSLPSSPTKCNDGRAAAGLPDSQDQIEGFQLIPDQNPTGNAIHELWLYADAGCTANLHTDNTAYFTWNGLTSAGQILPLRISPAVQVRCMIVRTISDPSFVAWQEIQVYQTVPPPQGFATFTVTPTITPTETATVSGTPATGTPTGTASVLVTASTTTPTMTVAITGTPPTQTPSTFVSTTPQSSVSSTATRTPTAKSTKVITSTASPSGTPISHGQNIASLGCANAYLQTSPAVRLGNNPDLAIDGNVGTEWNAGVAPVNGSYVIWQWSLPSIPTQCNDGRTVAGILDGQNQIDGLQLIPDQNPAGNSLQELWLYADANCTANIRSSNTAYFTWNGQTSAGQVLSARVSPVVPLRCVIVRTIDDSSFVAWEEIQVYQALPPPPGFATVTTTRTVTPTEMPVITGSPTNKPTTPTSTMTPSSSRTPSATLTPLPIVPGQNIARISGVIDASPSPIMCHSTPTTGPNSVCNAIDGASDTYWAPAKQSSDPQKITVQLAAVSPVPFPDNIIDMRVKVQSLNAGTSETYEIVAKSSSETPITCVFQSPSGGYEDGTQLDCPMATPVSGVTSASVLLFHGGTADGTYGVREFEIYNQSLSSKSARTCAGGCSTATAGSSRLVVATPLAKTPKPSQTGTPSTATGHGQGPGDAAVFAPNNQPQAASRAAALPSPTRAGPTPIPPPPPPSSGPVDFTIVLEVASGTGY